MKCGQKTKRSFRSSWKNSKIREWDRESWFGRCLGAMLSISTKKSSLFSARKSDPRTIRDDGMWVASLPEHSESLRREFPELRPIELFKDRGQKGFTGWLNFPDTEERFEESAIAICRLVIDEDPRIGKVPKPGAESLKKKSAKAPPRKHRRK